jgi:hypothetical protein
MLSHCKLARILLSELPNVDRRFRFEQTAEVADSVLGTAV